MTEVSLYELILSRREVTEAMEDYAEAKGKAWEEELKVVFVIDEGKWFLLEGYKYLVYLIIKEGHDYFDVLPVGEQASEVEFNDQEREYYAGYYEEEDKDKSEDEEEEDNYGGYGSYENYLKGKNKPEFNIPTGMGRWFPDSTLKHKGLENLGV